MQFVDSNTRPETDQLLIDIANYIVDYDINSSLAIETARWCLMDTLGCGMLALRYPECTKNIGPVVPGTQVPGGARVPGTQLVLDPVKAAWDTGCIIRWLDYNDTWLAAEWGHPSDNLGSILAISDFISQQNRQKGQQPLLMKDVLLAMIKAHEIQGVLALTNSFNRVGLDHVLLVKLASCGIVCHLLGGTREQVIDALSQAMVDGQSLRTYRHAPNTGSRKSWAAGDACARAVFLAYLTLKGEMGYPSALSAKTWGFEDVLFKGKKLQLSQKLQSYVMENILFKISYPAEFHAQTAVEAAIKLHSEVAHRLEAIERIEIQTHESAIRIISKVGPLHNPADRDHCLQYMTAIGLIFGSLTADHYEDNVAGDLRIDQLREKMHITENSQYSKDYLDPAKRSIANAVQVFFQDGSKTNQIEVQYPLGHKSRRDEGVPFLLEKFQANLATRFPQKRVEQIYALCNDQQKLCDTYVDDFMNLLVI